MSDTRQPPGDVLGLAKKLREAVSQPELAEFDRPDPITDAARLAAYELAVALGRCRLFGVEPGTDLDGTLPPLVAMAAARALHDQLRHWTESVRQLDQRWEDTPNPIEADDFCYDLLEGRMEAMAAFTVIDEAYADCLDNRDALLGEFTNAVDGVLDALQALDEGLQAQKDLLSLAAGTHLLENWRTLLAEPYHETPPWWLDGTLEEAAQRIRRTALETQPDGATWRRHKTRLFDPPRTPVVIIWFPRRIERVARLAAQGTEEPQAPIAAVSWTAPDAAHYAVLSVPETADDDSSLTVAFFDPQDRPTTEFDGSVAILASVPATIANGRAGFPIKQLAPHRQEEPILSVAGRIWTRESA
jgi:hypothetical protein